MPASMSPQRSARTKGVTRHRRRERTVFTAEQLQQLQSIFEKKRYPSAEDQEVLAQRLNLQKDAVKVWFKNQRAKLSKAKNRPTRHLHGFPDPQGNMGVDTSGLLSKDPDSPTKFTKMCPLSSCPCSS